jgi:chemotaxis protein CheD
MTDSLDRASSVYLRPGEWFTGQERALIKTILGSCVAVTMFHRSTGFAAICHALMPSCEQKKSCTGYCQGFSRYADCIVRRMSEMFLHRGVKTENIEVKLFGGADTLSSKSLASESLKVGARNIEQARKSLDEVGMRLSTSDVGGSTGRKIFFDTATGEVLLKRLNGSADSVTGRFLVEEIAGRIVIRGKAG